MLLDKKFQDFQGQLFKKTEEVITACNNLLVEMEKNNEQGITLIFSD